MNEGVSSRSEYRWIQTVQGADGYEDREFVIRGPLYHGGGRLWREGQQITPGRRTNVWGDDDGPSKHVYFTTQKDIAATYAMQTGGHVFMVEPMGVFRFDRGENEFKSLSPLRVVRRLEPSEWRGE